tara:strand:- start:371 stop:898 length:528 start_codon:yes stop_codon:yes gene_type:complete
MEMPHETNIAECINGIVSVPKDEVLKGSYCGGLVIRHNRQKMRVTAEICTSEYIKRVKINQSPKSKLSVNKLFLEKPIWNGGDFLVGVATKRFAKGDVMVYSRYRNKSGRPLWEGGLYVTEEFASTFPKKHYNNTAKPLTVYMIPLNELLEFNENKKDDSRPSDYIDFKWTPEPH